MELQEGLCLRSIIFVSCIIVWALSSYNFRLQAVSEDASMLASIGKILAPMFMPLGWGNWQGTVATLTGLVAKENVIGTFGILMGKQEIAENGLEVWQTLRMMYTPVAGYSLLVFNLLCAPCFAAIGAIHREMASKKWTWIAIGYQCGLAYVVSFILYQIGHVLLEGANVNLFTIIALVLLFYLVYMIVRKPTKKIFSTPLNVIKGDSL